MNIPEPGTFLLFVAPRLLDGPTPPPVQPIREAAKAEAGAG